MSQDAAPEPGATGEHVASTPIAVPTGGPGPRVVTAAGPVRGLWRTIVSAPDRVGPEPRYTRSAAFYGIPYAEEPTGERRFMAPVPRAAWTEELAALTPSATPQRGSIFADPAIPEPSVPGDDFLTLNVFTPAPGDDEARLPVFVWIHGGGWTSGSHNSPWYDGAAFNRDGVVTVSVAYRLGFDGYGYVPDSDAPYNRGVFDQVLALEWVRDNIARFGGDPARVTIGGQSAGGGNSMVLLSAPRAQGLFHGIVSESGAVPDLPARVNAANSAAMATSLGVEQSLAGFRSCDYDAVFAAQNAPSSEPDHADDGNATQAGPDPVEAVAGIVKGFGNSFAGLPFTPTVDGDILTAPIAQALREGQGEEVAVLAGSTTHDFVSAGLAYVDSAAGRDPRGILVAGGLPEALADRILAAHPEHQDAPHLIVGDVISDATFHVPVATWFIARDARAREAGEKAGSYAYEFTYCCGPMHMATHCMEIPFVFDCLAHPYCEHTLGGPAPQALADEMHQAWVRFIETGDPGWEPWAPRSVGRRFGDNRSGSVVIARDEPVFDTDREIVETFV